MMLESNFSLYVDKKTKLAEVVNTINLQQIITEKGAVINMVWVDEWPCKQQLRQCPIQNLTHSPSLCLILNNEKEGKSQQAYIYIAL